MVVSENLRAGMTFENRRIEGILVELLAPILAFNRASVR
jgi:hypothetical protein